jgi:hypothetical protein
MDNGCSGLATLLSTRMPENLRLFIPDPDGEDSYPIVTYSWLLLYKEYSDQQKLAALKQYVRWCLVDGQEFNESLGFMRLPPRVVSLATSAVDPRSFLRSAVVVGGSAFVGSSFLQGSGARLGYGALQPTPDLNDGEVRLAVPLGFSYVTFGIGGTIMSDGNPTPQPHDSMAAFRLPNGNIRLIRNHEDRDTPADSTLKGDPAQAYDPIGGGSCTSLDIEVTSSGERHLMRNFISINGTIVNCAGGATYSPDGATLFVNIQGDTRIGGPGNLGYTFAIWGPWEAGAL